MSQQLDRIRAKDQLAQLVGDFRQARSRGSLDQNTSERDVHRWVDRLLEVLGWDVDDVDQYSRESYTRGAGFADAVLLHNRQPVGYLEVKRLGGIPGLNLLRQERKYYSREEEQALRYARRSAQLPEGQRWTILTNFEQLYVFEATTEERLMAFESAEELVERFDDETRFLTREEILTGGLLRWTHRRGRPEVDEEFRNTLNLWRLGLAQDIYDRNHAGALMVEGETDVRLLQRAVQRLLDRLVVLQYATDLEAIPGEPLRQLLDLTVPSASTLVAPPSLRTELMKVFGRFDDFYNTTIFAPGHICEQVEIDDRLLREIVDEVASQNFRRFTSDILGTTYETYLGHQLEVDETGQVRLVVRPEVRRAGGIYYTPTEVVRYIVDQVLDPLLKDATAEDVSGITIIDPACGSGSFLVAAYNKLANWYEQENLRRREAIRAHLRENPGQAALGEEIPLPAPISDFHRRILEQSIYGVDLDPDAAELAAINLVMTAIKSGMTGGTLEKLPAVLGQNIKVGNSVVPGVQSLPGYGFTESLTEQRDVLGELARMRRELQTEDDSGQERALINQIDDASRPVADPVAEQIRPDGLDPDEHAAFVWTVMFPEVFDLGLPVEERGFSCVVGNPPWIGFTGAREVRPYLGRRFETCGGRFDMYVPFVELGMALLRERGRFGMITPSNYFLRDYGERLRRFLRTTHTLETVVDFGDRQIFQGATNYPAILIATRGEADPDSTISYRRGDYDSEASEYLQADLTDDAWHFLSPAERAVFERMGASPSVPLADVCLPNGIMEGIVTGQNKVFMVDEQRAAQLGLDDRVMRKCPRGQYIKRWRTEPDLEYVIYPYDLDAEGRTVPWDEDRLRTDYPKLYDYLSWARSIPSDEGGISGRDYFDSSNKQWWELWNPRDKGLLDRKKLITPEVAAVPNYAFAGSDVYVPNSASALFLRSQQEDDLFFVLGLLNSSVLGRYHRRTSVPKANGYLIYLNAFLKHIPIRFPEDEESKYLQSKITRLARLATEAATERELLELNFNSYIQEFEVFPAPRGNAADIGTIGSWIRRLPAQEQEILSIARGKLYSATAKMDGEWLMVHGKVRFSGSEYASGEYESEPLLRVRLPRERAEFLSAYIPWTHLKTPYSTAQRLTLSQKILRHPLPRFANDAELQQVLERYLPVAERSQELTTIIRNAESEIDEAVAVLYGLDDDDLAVLGIYQTP